MLQLAQAFKRFTIAGTLALTLAGLVGAQGVAAAGSTRNAADVKVGILPSSQADAGGLTAYTITATNDGVDAAGDVTISVPYNPAALRFVSATFSQPEAWVSNTTSKALEIKTGAVGGEGGSVKAVVRFQSLTSSGAPAVQRLSFEWTDKLKGGHGISNQLPSADMGGLYAPLTVSSASDGTLFSSDVTMAEWTSSGISAEVRRISSSREFCSSLIKRAKAYELRPPSVNQSGKNGL
jgi:hypothetical protein